MKILHLVHRYWPSHGGAEKSFQLLSESFAATGHRVTVYTTNAVDYRYFWRSDAAHVPAGVRPRKGVRVVRFPVRHLPFYRAPDRGPGKIGLRWLQHWMAHSPWLPSLIRASSANHASYGVVHASSLPVNVVLAAACRIARRSGVPLVLSPHIHTGERWERAGLRDQYTSPVQRDMLRQADAVIAKTPGERDFLVSLGVRRHRVLIAPNGLDLDEMAGGSAERFRRRFRIEGPIVLHLAHKSVLKGSRDTVEAMKLLWERGATATLVLAGSTEPGFARYLAGLDPRIRRRILELESPDEAVKKDALAAQDIFVLPSKADSFGYVFLESWYYEKPVIGAMAGGVPEVIDDGRDGLLVPFGQHHVLAEYIGLLLGNTDLGRRLGSAGGRKLRERYDWRTRVFPLYDNLYRRLAAGRGEGRWTHGRAVPR